MKISEETLRDIAPAHEREIEKGFAFIFGEAQDPQGAIWIKGDEWAVFRLVESHFTPEQVLLWWKWCEHLISSPVEELELDEFLRVEFAVVADVTVVAIDWQPIQTEVLLIDNHTAQRGVLHVYQQDWDAINPKSEFERIQFAQALEWEINWSDDDEEDTE